MASVLLLVASTSSLTSFDTGVRDRLSVDLGHSVTLRQNSQAVDTAGFDLLVIARSAGSGQPEGYADEDIPVFSMSHFSYANFKWGTGSVAVGSGETSLRIIGDAHPIHGGVVDTDSVTVLDGVSNQWRGLNGPAGTVQSHWRFAADTTPIVFSVPSSSTLLDGRTNPQREAAWGFGGDVFGGLTATGLDIFDAAVEWTLDEQGGSATPLATPTGFSFTAHGSLRQLNGSWDAVPNAATYEAQVDQETSPGTWTNLTTYSGAATSFQLTDADGVDWATTYRSRVRAHPAE